MIYDQKSKAYRRNLVQRSTSDVSRASSTVNAAVEEWKREEMTWSGWDHEKARLYMDMWDMRDARLRAEKSDGETDTLAGQQTVDH